MEKINKTAIFKTNLLAIAILTLSGCNNLHTKQEFTDEADAELDQQLIAQQIRHRDSTNWYIKGCPWYGCTGGM